MGGGGGEGLLELGGGVERGDQREANMAVSRSYSNIHFVSVVMTVVLRIWSLSEFKTFANAADLPNWQRLTDVSIEIKPLYIN